MLKQIIKAAFSTKLILHSDLLSLQEIQTAIKQVIPTKEELFIKELQEGRVNLSLWNQVKKHYIHPQDAITIIQSLPANSRLFDYFLIFFKRKVHQLTFKQIADILQTYAIAKRFDQQFFRFMENEIFDKIDEEKQFIQYQDVEKVLWAYQHCQYGSAQLYKSLAKIIKIAQYEINPMKLAYYSYLYAKAPERVTDVIKLTEQRVLDRIADYKFKQFVKLAKYFFTRNIGSNSFQIQIEENLSEMFPNYDIIEISDLINLNKATIGYYFKYNEKSLYNKLEVFFFQEIFIEINFQKKSATIQLLDQVNDHQFSELLWTFLKGNRGNYLLYEKALKELKKRRKLLSMRELTILLLNSVKNIQIFSITQELYKEIQNRLKTLETESNKTTRVYLLYIYMALIKSDMEIEQQFSDQIKKVLIDHQDISPSIKLNLLQALNGTHKDMIELLVSQLEKLDLDLESKIMVSYSCQRFEIGTKIQLDTIDEQVSKQIFYQALYLQPDNQRLIDVLILLSDQHGENFRFFFKQDHWVVIAWAILSENLLNSSKLISRDLIEQASLGIKEMDINMVSVSNLNLYVQALWMIQMLEGEVFECRQLTQGRLRQFLAQMMRGEQTELLSILQQTITQQFKSLNIEVTDVVAHTNMFDSGSNLMIPVALLVEIENDQILKFALIAESSSQKRESLVLREVLKYQEWSAELIGKDQMNSEYVSQIFSIEQ